MRIAVLVGGFPLVSETFIVRQLNALLDLGHEVVVYPQFAATSDVIQPELGRAGLLDRVVYLQGRRQSHGKLARIAGAARQMPVLWRAMSLAPDAAARALNPLRHSYRHQALLSPLRRAEFIADVFSHGRMFDVVHAHFGPVAAASLFVKAVVDAPLVVTFHGWDLVSWPAQRGNDVYRDLFDRVSLVTCGSDYAGGILRDLGCPPSKIRKIPMGIPVEQFAYSAHPSHKGGPLSLLSVARLTPVKGLDYAIRAIAIVRDRGWSVRYDIVGEGPLRMELEALIAGLGLRENVTLHGAQDSQFVRARMASADIFLMSSVTVNRVAEGQGLVVQEAQACGLPVIATASGGIAEGLLDGQSGLVVPEREPHAIASAIIRLAEDEAMRRQMGLRGRRFVEEHFEIVQVTRELVDAYREAAGLTRGLVP